MKTVKMLTHFENLHEHPWYGPRINKLKKPELMMMGDFIEENGELETNEFVHKVNRMFINKEKPKNWAMIMEMLTVIAQGVEQ